MCASGALAHKASDAYLQILPSAAASASATAAASAAAKPMASEPFDLRLSLALKDLDAAIPSLDANDDRQLTWGEVKAALPAITRWVAAGVGLECGAQAVAVPWQMQALEQRSDGAYLRLAAPVACGGGQALALNYRLMAGIDPTHRLLLSGNLGGPPFAAVMAPQGRSALLLRPAAASSSPQAAQPLPSSGWQTLQSFFAEGVHHIATGFDHLAFLLALLLPIQLLRRSPGQGAAVSLPAGAAAQSASAFSGAWLLLRTVTGFTVGHSVTLALASLGWISASPAWVEPAIAITIGAAALLNVYPLPRLRTDYLALAFGLVHGLGFSGVMTELGVSGSLLVWGLAGFNLGVEAGQLLLVALWCVLQLLVGHWPHYQRVVVRGGSWALLALAGYWTLQRLLF